MRDKNTSTLYNIRYFLSVPLFFKSFNKIFKCVSKKEDKKDQEVQGSAALSIKESFSRFFIARRKSDLLFQGTERRLVAAKAPSSHEEKAVFFFEDMVLIRE